jgi:EpsI family protein
LSQIRTTWSRIRAADWRHIALGVSALSLAAIAYRTLFEPSSGFPLEQDVEMLFFHSTASGPPVVMAVALWFIYRRWYRLIALPRQASWSLGLGLLLPSILIYGWATYTGARDLLIPALMLNLMGCGALLWGAGALRVLALPISFLVLAMRIPTALLNEILWKLQLWTGAYAGSLLRLIGLPASIAGDQILLPDQQFAIIETCAGLRSCESLTILAFLMVDLFQRRGIHAGLLICLAPLIAFGVNGIRVVTLILNPSSEVAEIHTLQGIAMLLVGVVALYGIDWGLEKWLPQRGRTARQKPPAGTAGLAGPLIATAALAVLVVLSTTLPRWEAPVRGSQPFPDSQIPKTLDAWASTKLKTDLSFLGIVRFRARVDRLYERNGESVALFVGVGSRDPRYGSPFSPKTAYPGTGWWSEETRQISLQPDGRPARVNVLRYGTGGRRKLAFDWTEGSEGLGDEIFRFAAGLDSSAWGRPREGVAVRISTPLPNTRPARQAAAEALLLDFYRSLRPKLDLVGFQRGDDPQAGKAFPHLGKSVLIGSAPLRSKIFQYQALRCHVASGTAFAASYVSAIGAGLRLALPEIAECGGSFYQ